MTPATWRPSRPPEVSDPVGPTPRLNRRPALSAALCVCLLTGVIMLAQAQTATATRSVERADHLIGFDFDGRIARIEATCFDWYPSQLYTPDDFARGVGAAPSPITRRSGQYGTYRLVVDLTPGQVYGLTAYSATYAQSLWVDGRLLSEVGRPGTDAASSVPKTSYYTVYFTAQAGGSEIVVQRSEFVHAQGGQLYPQYLGSQQSITTMVDKARLRGGIIAGSMLAAGMFLLGFFVVSRRPRFLYFSLACLSIMVRTLITDQKLIMVLFPDLSWRMSHGIEAGAMVGFAFFVLLYLNQMTDRQLPRALLAANWALASLSLSLVLFLPSTVYTRLIPTLQIVYLGLLVLAFAWTLRLMTKARAPRGVEQCLVLAGAGALGVLAAADVTRYRFTGRYDDLNLLQAGMMVFVFTNMLALALDFSRSEEALTRTRRQAEELERQEQMRRVFLSDISHEMRTPLTVMSNYAQYTRAQLEDGTVDQGTSENLLTISLEANRLALLAGQLLTSSASPPRTAGLEPVAPERLLARAAAICGPILQTRGNRLDWAVAAGCPDVLANEDMVIQVLTNLCVNANRHTEGGSVRMGARARADAVAFSVEDDGEGVRPDLLERVFERGVSGDQETGLGLAICRDVVEFHGGLITLESAPGQGTSVTFTLPLADRGDQSGRQVEP
ncbi:MAG: sensor histidine kinase [Propionibacteriaceae bacterium]|jgi:signal transduction histidine kinase|nr:sensor histidine kinase [Propionibacteriaceae bacterium]